jgi:hypothetical protein
MINTPDSKQPTLIAFLSIFETEAKDGYLGAILVTDSQGIPQEFRCTHPVKPTNVQKSLYGETLLPHVTTNLCGVPLVKALQTKPSLILIKEDTALGIRGTTPCPVALVRRAGTAIDVRGAGDSATLQKTRLENKAGRFQPVVIEAAPGESETARSILEKAFGNMDPLEPFERMTSAVQLLTKHDKRFQ